MNLHQVALLPAVRRLAQTLESTYKIWIGLISEMGEFVAFPRGDNKICRHFMANGLTRDGRTSSCAGCVRAWGTESHPLVQCHVGFDALLVPFASDTGTGRIYASGFLMAENAEERLETLRGVVPELISEDDLDQVPILDRRKRDVVASIMRAMAAEIEDDAKPTTTPEPTRYGKMIGRSEPMIRLFDRMRRVAASNSTVLIQGENGTGKELIARAIHQNSPRAQMPFIAQNCAAIAPDLIASELFGHKRGAFSGAHRDRVGLFETADGGTFFLDEIGEMDVGLQAKLLRVLQEGTFLPVGGSTVRKVNVRVLCATNRDLRAEVAAGRFREDLYYRVNVIGFTAPPLRHRREDVALLARFFLDRACHKHEKPQKRFSQDALAALTEHLWPGNVRELENEVERLVIMTLDDTIIQASELRLGGNTRSDTSFVGTNITMPEAVERLERQMILESLKRTGWNKTKTAEKLGVSRRNLIRKVANYELERQRNS